MIRDLVEDPLRAGKADALAGMKSAPSGRTSQQLHEVIELFQFGVFNDDAPAAFAVFHPHFQSQGALESQLNVADVRIDGFFLLLPCSFAGFRVEQSLHIALGLAYAHRESRDLLGRPEDR